RFALQLRITLYELQIKIELTDFAAGSGGSLGGAGRALSNIPPSRQANYRETMASSKRRHVKEMCKECFMSSDAMHHFLQTVEAEVQSRPTPTEFEMAYQARVAMDRIRFAI